MTKENNYRMIRSSSRRCAAAYGFQTPIKPPVRLYTAAYRYQIAIMTYVRLNNICDVGFQLTLCLVMIAKICVFYYQHQIKRKNHCLASDQEGMKRSICLPMFLCVELHSAHLHIKITIEITVTSYLTSQITGLFTQPFVQAQRQHQSSASSDRWIPCTKGQ